MRGFVLSPVACLAVPYFSSISHKRHDLQKRKAIEHKVCFDFLYKQSSFEEELSKIDKKMYIGLCVKCPLFLSDFNET